MNHHHLPQEETKEQIYEKLLTYSTQFPLLLHEFKKSYVLYNKNPASTDYETNYKNNKASLQTITHDLSALETSLQNKINKMNEKILVLDKKLNEKKIEKDDLFFMWKQINGANNGASILVKNTQEEYNNKYISNVCLLLGIIILLGIYIYGYFL